MIASVNRERPSSRARILYDFIAVSLLAAACACIWADSLSHGAQYSDFILNGLAILLVAALSFPWKIRTCPAPVSNAMVVGAWSLLSLGWIGGSVTLQSLGWTVGLSALLKSRLDAPTWERIKPLMMIVMLWFPWLELDFAFISFWLRRLSSAIVLVPLSWMGLVDQGFETIIVIGGHTVSLVEDCDGRGTLHSLLLTGLSAAFIIHGRRRPIWHWIPLLMPLAVIANALRLISICISLTLVGHRVNAGMIHDAASLLAMASMLLLCTCLFCVLKGTRQVIPTNGRGIDDKKVGASSCVVSPEKGSLSVWMLLAFAVCLAATRSSLGQYQPSERIEAIREAATKLGGSEAALTDLERERLGDANACRFYLSVGGDNYVLTAIDGSRNRHAVHDPFYCWQIIDSCDIEIPEGNAIAVRTVDEKKKRDMLFWYSNGRSRYGSPARYFIHTSLKRLSLGLIRAEPVLIMVESGGEQPTNWFRFIDNFSFSETW